MSGDLYQQVDPSTILKAVLHTVSFEKLGEVHQRARDHAYSCVGGHYQNWKTAYVRDEVPLRDVAQLGSAPEWGSGGRRFESGRPDLLQHNDLRD